MYTARRHHNTRTEETVKLEAGTSRAVEWIVNCLKNDPRADRVALIEQASLKFNLSPLEAEFLYGRFLQRAL